LDGRIKNPDKTRTFLKTRPDTRTGAEKEDVSGETRTYGNPRYLLIDITIRANSAYIIVAVIA